MNPIGAHVSAAGGLYQCFTNGEKIRADCIQIFGASPRQWAARLPDQQTIQQFRDAKKNSQIDQLFLHASYLVNLAAPNEESAQKSINNLSVHLQIAELLSAEGLVFHLGSWKGTTREAAISQTAENMTKVLRKAPGKSFLIMENSAGGGSKLGVEIEEIGEIFHLTKNTRVKVCLDTAHLFAGGQIENFTTVELEKLAARCEKSFGLQNLIVIHANDSKTAFKSHSDRHENIGHGKIGLTAFKNLRSHPCFGSIPWILEVPGFENRGPDQKNIEILRDL